MPMARIEVRTGVQTWFAQISSSLCNALRPQPQGVFLDTNKKISTGLFYQKFEVYTISTEMATFSYASFTSSKPPMTLMKRRAYGEYITTCKMLLIRTRVAQYSWFPLASWFHIMTIAIHLHAFVSKSVCTCKCTQPRLCRSHLASPTMITPSRYAGRSGSVAQANPSITRGPMTQLSRSEKSIWTHRRDEENILGRASH